VSQPRPPSLDSRLKRAGLKFSRCRQRYQRSLRAHPLIAGLRLERILRHITTDATTNSIVRQLAEAALRCGSVPTLAALHEELADSGHPLADRYDWDRVCDGLALDSAVEGELDEIASAFGSRAEALRRLRAAVEANPDSQEQLKQSLRRLCRNR